MSDLKKEVDGAGAGCSANASQVTRVCPLANGRWWGTALSILFLLVCFVPLVAYCHIIYSVGGNNVSNDYLNIVPFIDRVLSGNYDWRNLLVDTFNAQHWSTSAVLLHLAVAKFFSWDARLELYLGLALSFVRVILLVSILRQPSGGKLNFWLAGGVLALAFSMSQASNYLYGIGSLAAELGLLGWTIGLWGITRCRSKVLGIVLMVVGGLVSSSSWGNVVPCWVAYLLALWLFGYRRIYHYAAWVCGVLMGLGPYAYFFLAPALVAKSSVQASHAVPDVTFLNWSFIVNGMGRPFTTNIAHDVGSRQPSVIAGYFGFIAASATLLFLSLRRVFSPAVKASLVLIVYGLISILQLSLLRSWVMAWYTSFVIDFWIGLWALSVILIGEFFNKGTASDNGTTTGANSKFRLVNRFGPAVGLLTACILTVIYVLSNHTYEDKLKFLDARSPASEAAARNYRTAPTYCEGLLFEWMDQPVDDVRALCEPLERHSISAFAHSQQWTLQGDFVLHTVKLLQDSLSSPARWIPSFDVMAKRNWDSYEHLNLYLPSPGAVVWRVDLPSNIVSAQLVTAFGVARDKGVSPRLKSPLIFDVVARCEQLGHSGRSDSQQGTVLAHVSVGQSGDWHKVIIPLTRFKGNSVVLTLSSVAGANSAKAVFQYPHIDVKFAREGATQLGALAKGETSDPSAFAQGTSHVQVRPSNTDISPFFPHETANDFSFPDIASSYWHSGTTQFPSIKQTKQAKVVVLAALTSLMSPDNLGIPLRRYSNLMIEMCHPQNMPRHAMKVFLKIDQGLPQVVSIPLLADDRVHKYTYDLKLLQPTDRAVLNQLVLCPASKYGGAASDTIMVKQVKLIARTDD